MKRRSTPLVLVLVMFTSMAACSTGSAGGGDVAGGGAGGGDVADGGAGGADGGAGGSDGADGTPPVEPAPEPPNLFFGTTDPAASGNGADFATISNGTSNLDGKTFNVRIVRTNGNAAPDQVTQ
ncbi:MAG: hypothetical protein AAFQ09_09085 [Pseudomonadota bacterium]